MKTLEEHKTPTPQARYTEELLKGMLPTTIEHDVDFYHAKLIENLDVQPEHFIKGLASFSVGMRERDEKVLVNYQKDVEKLPSGTQIYYLIGAIPETNPQAIAVRSKLQPDMGFVYASEQKGEKMAYTVDVLPTTFFPTKTGHLCALLDNMPTLILCHEFQPDSISFEGQLLEEFRISLKARNGRGLYEIPEKLKPLVDIQIPIDWAMTCTIFESPVSLFVSASQFPILTGQETDCLIQGAGDGKRGSNWFNQFQRDSRIWQKKGASHRLEVSRQLEGEADLLEWEVLELLTKNQNSDFALAFNYIAGVLCPPITTGEQRNIIGGEIDLNDVLLKIGWLNEKPNIEKKEQLRSQLWDFIRFGAQAKVIGRRTVEYRDPITREKIETEIESSPWQITDKEYPKQQSLFSEMKPAPVKVFIVISQQWQPIFEDPRLAQFYPCGELLGRIAPNKPSGDWARLIGLTLARLWRIYPRKTIEETFSPTRRELLTHFAPKTKTVTELLESEDPKRAVKYYIEALNILVRTGLLAHRGDAAKEMTPTQMLKAYGRKGWQKEWLDGRSNLFPGERWIPIVQERCSALPPAKPRNLTAKKQRNRS